MSPASAAIDHRVRVGQERSARTERRILEAALRVFAERGPDAPVIDEFVEAAGIARGTFYNYFRHTGELLEATSEWTTREALQLIGEAIAGLEEPTLRLGVGLRLFFDHARRDPVWSRFIARVWNIGGLDLPIRDLEAGVRSGHFRVPGPEVARDLLFGGIRQALARIGEGHAPPRFGEQMTEMCLQALRANPRRIAAVLEQDLSRLPAQTAMRGAPRSAGQDGG